jgi:peptidoglycan/xylan/chitin deacetylase (PgdA/CDA1 family)
MTVTVMEFAHPIPKRWRPTPFIAGSLALHGAALAVIAVAPAAWPWALGAVVANHIALMTAGLFPRTHVLGPNWTRLPAAAAARGEIAITIDDGPDPEVTPRVLDMLGASGVRATFFCIGTHVAAHPELALDIVRRGHAIENHSEHHVMHFSLLGIGGMRREAAGAQAIITRTTGQSPLFFRAPAGLRSPLLEPALARLGLQLASWTRRGYDTRTRDPDTVARRLLANLAAGDILLLHDGNAARTDAGEPLILAVLPRVIAAVRAAGLKPVTLRAAQ